ncbi:protein RESPONSE TO LOW SULFUR 2-like [Silene latifolia]|uniref:protein RESPONSE TO LOW SULFUR 2-like n=1 Tax=Silene latifolia TaxID=37657 RepID=UPI003D7720C2
MFRNNDENPEAVVVEETELKRRNDELESRLKASKMREEKMREELRRALERARLAEEAEEMLSSQLGEFEAEAVDQARDYHVRILQLMEQLSRAHNMLQAHNLTL